MKRLLGTIALGFVLALSAGCSDDSGTKPDAGRDGGADKGPAKDLAPKPDVTLEDNTGEGCVPGSNVCKPGSPTCIIYDDKTQKGICSRECTPDDSQTPLLNEDDCGAGKVCASFRFGNDQVFNFCVLRCEVSLTKNPCPASSGQTCAPNSTQFSDLDQTVCWFGACKDGKDCAVTTATTCKNDTDCASAGAGAFCQTGLCNLPGNCSAGGICGPHTHGKTDAKVGASCTSDLDCPNAGFCLRERDGYPNGYCTVRSCSTGLPEFACPTGSTCHRLFYGGLCHISCDQTDASSCRGNAADKGGDYECYAWNNLTIGSGAVSDTPVCTVTTSQSCDSLGTSLDCTSLGDQANGTNMTCRNPKTNAVLSSLRDPKGICLDDTASGPFAGAADAGVPDQGTPDVGVPDQGTPDAGVPDQATPTPDQGAEQGVDI